MKGIYWSASRLMASFLMSPILDVYPASQIQHALVQTNLVKELDFLAEATNAAALAHRMQHRHYVAVPAPVPQVCSSSSCMLPA